MGFVGTIRKGIWNAFRYDEQRSPVSHLTDGPGYSHRPDRVSPRYNSERTIIASIYTHMAMDVAAIDIRHVELDEKGRYKADKESELQKCFTLEANLDQAPSHFRRDIAMTMFDEGVAAIVPVETDHDPHTEVRVDIRTLRVGTVVAWHPYKIRTRLWDIDRAKHSEIMVDKRTTAIVENPLFAIMNEPNSTLQRLKRKLALLDAVDEQSGSGRLDLIIQLPYTIKTETKKQQSEQRRKDIEFQLRGSQYGIAYTDASEKITQLNRPAENNLFEQVKYLTELLYEQLGLTPSIINGTADEATMRNYFHRTIEPIVRGIVEAMHRAFVGDKKKEAIRYFYNPFKMVPIKDMADIGDKFIRNKIATPNELREVIGFAPHSDPSADTLDNPNMPAEPEVPPTTESEGDSQNES